MNQKPLILLKESYLALIRNSVKTSLFKNIFIKTDSTKKDILRNGQLSCAYFVSSILTIVSLINRPHATVAGTIKDLEKSGWQKIKQPKPGSILVWENKKFGSEIHSHIGFYLGNHRAISNSTTKKVPLIHFWTFGAKGSKNYRAINAIYWNSKLK